MICKYYDREHPENEIANPHYCIARLQEDLEAANQSSSLQMERMGERAMTYDLNGADARSAMLWFLKHERLRHYQDIQQAEKDIEALERQGVKCPDNPPLDTFIVIKGGSDTQEIYGFGNKDGMNGPD